MSGHVFSRAVVIACVLAAAYAPRAAAQCIIQSDAEFESPLTDQQATVRFKASGFIICPGLFQGDFCVSGNWTGTCSQNTQNGFVVTCSDRCTAEYGEDPHCDQGPADQVSFGTLSLECVRGVCVGTNSNGTCSVTTLDPASRLEGLERCGEEGLTATSSYGAVALVCPQ